MAWAGKMLFLGLPPLIVLHIRLLCVYLKQMYCYKTVAKCG